jgi:hypothetical protein|tara:strand:+ start:331 stop:561 length:231 start_codon:yes stop_codon:yes gene_type:complete
MGIQVQTDNPMYVRDIHSKALLNTDYTALQQHRREKAYFLKQESDINILRTQVDKLSGIREEMLEIKTLLREIIKK